MQATKTYLENSKTKTVALNISENGTIEKYAIEESVDDDAAAVIIQPPNFFGGLEDMQVLGSVFYE
jgi:glycine dehydrogenase subunit 1